MTVRLVRLTALAFALSLAAAVTAGAQAKSPTPSPKAEKWTGVISDSMCAKSHGANGGTMAKDHDCTLKCVKGGEQYVLVVGDKIYKIGNQKLADLERHAGHKVDIEGTAKGDTITVTKVTMLPVK